MVDERAAGPFGARLRQWRGHRGISQLALAAKVGSTARHLSFLETGRSRPGRHMVLRLGEALGLPLRERNQLLRAAGLAAAYPEAELAGPDLAPHRSALETLLRAHEPYPALVVDRHWTVQLANPASHHLYGHDLVGVNIIRRFVVDPAARHVIVNWPQVAWAGLHRLRHHRDQTPFDQTLTELVHLAETALHDVPQPDEPNEEPVLCPWFQIGGQIIKTIGIAARFDPTTDVTLDELRIELTYPLDAVADAFFRHAAATPGPGQPVPARITRRNSSAS